MERNEKGQFINGIPIYCRYSVGTIRIRTRHKRGNVKRNFIKIAEPNKWQEYPSYIWEKHYGPIPKGYVIHHIDGNALNDVIENLSLVSRAEHLALHWNEFDHEKRIRNSTETRRKMAYSTKSKTKITGRHPALCECPLHKR